jgi:anti-anti-sigma regulatory factor
MRIDTERQGDIAVLALDGELDASNYEDVIRAARTAYAEGARHLVLDLGELSYMGSAGLVALHAAGLIFQGIEPPGGEAGWDALTQFGADVSTSRFHEVMKLAAVPPTVDRVFSHTGMGVLFEQHPDRAAAIAAAGG